MESKKLPVGIDSFEKLRREDFYYIDKTGLIRDLLNNWGEVNLFTRPRRFGKTLNMSMLKSFFEVGADKTLFDGLLISRETAPVSYTHLTMRRRTPGSRKRFFASISRFPRRMG